jgi:hypothetical protein
MNYRIQSVLFEKELFSLEQAVAYLVRHNMITKKVDITDKYYRFRQISPETLKRQGLNKFRTVHIKDGIEYIIGYSN